MKCEAEVLACTNPLLLPEESRFLSGVDGDRYVRGEGCFHDKSYWLSAMRAAVAAGRRAVKKRNASRRNSIKRREELLNRGRGVRAQIVRDFHDVECFPFSAERNKSGKRVVSPEETMMRIMCGNKRFKPGD